MTREKNMSTHLVDPLDPPVKQAPPTQPIQVVVGAEVVAAEVVGGTQGSGGWPPGEKRGWSSGLCDCFSECTSCCAVFWCGPTVLGQLAEKLSRRPKTCVAIATLIWAGAVAHMLIKSRSSKLYMLSKTTNIPVYWSTFLFERFSVLYLLAMAGAIVSLILLLAIRRHIRHRDGIAPTTMKDPCIDAFDDLVCSLCCSACVTCQIMRHEKLTEGRYKLCSPTGEKL